MLNLEEEEEQTHLLTYRQSRLHRELQDESFKLMNSENGTTTFLPLDSKIGGQIRNDRPSAGQFVTRKTG